MSYRYRAYPATEQVDGLFTHAKHARFVWNLACEQQALRDYDRAMRGFFNRSHRKPSWRKAGRDESFCIRDVRAGKLNRRWGRVFVPKVGWLRFRLTRPLAGKSGMARVTLDPAGRWHVSFTATQPEIERQPTGSEVGIDRGVATTLALSTGQHYQAPHSPKADRKARKLAARLSRAKRGSKRRADAEQALAKLHAQAADRRKNWVEKTTTTLIREHDVIVLEDLRIKNIVRRPEPKPDPEQPGALLPNNARAKAGLNKSIHRSCWGLFAQRLQDKATVSGVTVMKVNPAHSSVECRACGHTASGNRESQAVFRCLECGHENHADTNAAQNVLARGLRLAPTPGHEGQDLAPARSARVNPEQSVARTTRTKAAA